MSQDKEPELGVAKLVTLGEDKVLVIQVNNDDAPEGEYTIKAITANLKGITGAGTCYVQINN